MRHVTREEMREIDRRAIEEYGVPVDTLMENAGRAVADAVQERTSPACPIVAVCGRGNNGGDGFVAARHLLDRGYEVEVFALDLPPDASSAPGRAWEKVKGRLEQVQRFKARPMAVLIDALLGTGLSRPVEGRERKLIAEMNAFDPRWFPIVAVDLPSGLDANTGRPLGVAVKASVTVTLGLPKVGFSRPEARKYLGEVVVADIGFPPELLG